MGLVDEAKQTVKEFVKTIEQLDLGIIQL